MEYHVYEKQDSESDDNQVSAYWFAAATPPAVMDAGDIWITTPAGYARLLRKMCGRDWAGRYTTYMSKEEACDALNVTTEEFELLTHWHTRSHRYSHDKPPEMTEEQFAAWVEDIRVQDEANGIDTHGRYWQWLIERAHDAKTKAHPLYDVLVPHWNPKPRTGRHTKLYKSPSVIKGHFVADLAACEYCMDALSRRRLGEETAEPINELVLPDQP